MIKKRTLAVSILSAIFALAGAATIAACKINVGPADKPGDKPDVPPDPPHEHTYVEKQSAEYLKADATCTHGATYYKSCSGCGEKSSETFEVGEGKGHSPKTLPAKKATCIETGLTEGTVCSECKLEIVAQKVIPLAPHEYYFGVCTVCEESAPASQGLIFDYSDDYKHCILAGLGICTDKDVVVPDTNDDLPVKEIKFSAFEMNTAIDTVTLPSTAGLAIGDRAFRGSGIKAAIIPANVTKIGNSAFEDCKSLTYVEIKEGACTTIGRNAFAGCTALEEIVIPEGITSIEDKAFSGCGLKKVTLPSTLTHIAVDAFYGNGNLVEFSVTGGNAVYTSVDGNLYKYQPKSGAGATELVQYAPGKSATEFAIPDGVVSVGGYSFLNSKLTSISIPDSVKLLKDNAFYGCNSLTSVNISDSVTYIGMGVFDGCSELASVSVGSGVNYVDSEIFKDTKVTLKEYGNALYAGNAANPYAVLIRAKDTNITTCNVHADAKVIAGSAFANCVNLTSLTLPDGLRAMGNGALYNCVKLETAEYGNGYYLGSQNNAHLMLVARKYVTVQTDIHAETKIINADAFYGNKDPNAVISDLVIPNGVTHIGDGAFADCVSVQVTIPKSVIYLGVQAFKGSPQAVINYQGTVAEWNRIVIGLDCWADATPIVVHCTDGNVTVA